MSCVYSNVPYRSTVQIMMGLLDSQRAERRRRQLKHCVYQKKVWMITHELVLFVEHTKESKGNE